MALGNGNQPNTKSNQPNVANAERSKTNANQPNVANAYQSNVNNFSKARKTYENSTANLKNRVSRAGAMGTPFMVLAVIAALAALIAPLTFMFTRNQSSMAELDIDTKTGWVIFGICVLLAIGLFTIGSSISYAPFFS
jgi:hypothetical protein